MSGVGVGKHVWGWERVGRSIRGEVVCLRIWKSPLRLTVQDYLLRKSQHAHVPQRGHDVPATGIAVRGTVRFS